MPHVSARLYQLKIFIIKQKKQYTSHICIHTCLHTYIHIHRDNNKQCITLLCGYQKDVCICSFNDVRNWRCERNAQCWRTGGIVYGTFDDNVLYKYRFSGYSSLLKKDCEIFCLIFVKPCASCECDNEKFVVSM